VNGRGPVGGAYQGRNVLCPMGCGTRLYGEKDPHDCVRATDVGPAKPERAALSNAEAAALRMPSLDEQRYAKAVAFARSEHERERRRFWDACYAHALQGLLAAPAEVRSEGDGDQNKLAARYANDALDERDRRWQAPR